MRRIAVVLALLGSLALPARALDLPEVRQRGKLRAILAGDADAPDPQSRFLARKAGDFTGIEGEILAGFARQQKVELELVYIATWDQLLPALLQKKGDLIAGGMTATDERRKLIDFTSETFPTRDVVVTRRPHAAVQT